MKIRKIEHLGLACRSAEAAAKFYADVLGLPVVARETLDDMKLKVIKVGAGESVLELLEPLDGEPVISKFLGSRGEGIHHVCLQVEDIREAIRELKEKGYSPLWDEPKVGAGGKWVTFLRPKETFGVLLELNQETAHSTQHAGESPASPPGGRKRGSLLSAGRCVLGAVC